MPGEDESKKTEPTTEVTGFEWVSDDPAGVGHDRIYNDAYFELAMIVTGEAPADTPPSEDSFKEKVLAYLEENRDRLHEKICIEFDYCARKKRFGKLADMLNAVAALIAIVADLVSFGTASAVWLLSSSVLDVFCGCD